VDAYRALASSRAVESLWVWIVEYDATRPTGGEAGEAVKVMGAAKIIAATIVTPSGPRMGAAVRAARGT
jgi:hypothetical protein